MLITTHYIRKPIWDKLISFPLFNILRAVLKFQSKYRVTFQVLTAQLVALCISLQALTTLNETLISFAVLKDHEDFLDVLDEDFERAVPADLTRNSNKKQEISNKIKKFYFADQHVSKETLLQFVNVSTCKQLQFKFRTN